MKQRIIKFRAWDKEEKGYIVEPIAIFGDVVMVQRGGELVSVPDAIPLQYTGLLDKNGKEIYEGDIIRRFDEVNESYGHDNCEVSWNSNRCYWQIDGRKDYYGHINGSHAKEGRYEVIGNIYSNPELLK